MKLEHLYEHDVMKLIYNFCYMWYYDIEFLTYFGVYISEDYNYYNIDTELYQYIFYNIEIFS